jgi:hypothetical protein
MRSSGNSDHSPCSSRTKLFHIEFSDLHISKEESIKPWCHQLQCQLFEAKYFADEDSVFVPADVAAIVHPSQRETLRVGELRQLARQSDRAGVVEIRFASTLVIAASIIAVVRLARDQDIGRRSPGLASVVADSVALARTILVRVIR